MPYRILAAFLSTAAVLMCSTSVVEYRVTAQSVQEQNVSREWGYLPLRDGVKLSYVIYRPTKEGRYPTLLEFWPNGVVGFQFAQVKR